LPRQRLIQLPRQGYAGPGSFEAMPLLSPQKTEAIAEPEVARIGAQKLTVIITKLLIQKTKLMIKISFEHEQYLGIKN
jgi:hypothetical protein